MKVTPRPTRFELAGVRLPAGGRQIVLRMVVGNDELVGTPTDGELRFLRSAIAELLNDPAGTRLPAFPSHEPPDEGPRLRPKLRRLWTPS